MPANLHTGRLTAARQPTIPSNTTFRSAFPFRLHQSSPIEHAVSGNLLDSSSSNAPANLATITFTATSPVTIPSTTTNSAGNYAVNGLVALPKGSYNTQASFAGSSLYNSATYP